MLFRSPHIEVDGGQNSANARRSVQAGANAIVAGSAVFGSGDYAAAIAAVRGAGGPSTKGAGA